MVSQVFDKTKLLVMNSSLSQLRLVLLLSLAVLGSCDLPVSCSYADALGTWTFDETARTGDRSIDCSELGTVVYSKQFTLEYPNLVTDELGHTGTWTLIYNQGFEVSILPFIKQ